MRLSRLAKVAIATAVVLAGWIAFRERYRITAWIWHVRHGGVLSIAGYTVPVPTDWLVDTWGPNGDLLVRLGGSRAVSSGATAHTPLTIAVLQEHPLKDLDYWTSMSAAAFKTRGTETVLHRDIDLNGESFHCLGGNGIPVRDLAQVQLGLSWDCRSSGPLEIMISGREADQEEAWKIVSGIRKPGRSAQP
jgi:hypothetical protein